MQTFQKASKIAIAKQRRGSLGKKQSKIAGSNRRSKTPVNKKKLSAARRQLGKEGGCKFSGNGSGQKLVKAKARKMLRDFNKYSTWPSKSWLLRNGKFRQLCGPVQKLNMSSENAKKTDVVSRLLYFIFLYFKSVLLSSYSIIVYFESILLYFDFFFALRNFEGILLYFGNILVLRKYTFLLSKYFLALKNSNVWK